MMFGKTLEEFYAQEFEKYIIERKINEKEEKLNKIRRKYKKIECPICHQATQLSDKYCPFCGSVLTYKLSNNLFS